MAPFFKSGRVFSGITQTVVTILIRGFEKISDAQSTLISSSEDATCRSDGTGAKLETVIGSEEARPEKIFLPESIKKEFKAGNTPVETFLKFLTACRQHINDTTLDIYTKESQIFLSNEIISNLELGRVAETYTDADFEKKIKGNRSVFKFERYPPNRFAYPDFRYKRGKQPEFLTKGIDKNGSWLGVTLGPF